MFDSVEELPPAGAAALAGLIEQNHAELKAAECTMLQLACAWADLDYLDSSNGEYQPLIVRACAWGGEGTPEVSEYCAAELGTLQGTGIMAARSLIADALDLRCRLPRLWGRVLTGGVRAWQARRIAEQTRPVGLLHSLRSLRADRAWWPPTSSSFAEERTPLLSPPQRGGARSVVVGGLRRCGSCAE